MKPLLQVFALDNIMKNIPKLNRLKMNGLKRKIKRLEGTLEEEKYKKKADSMREKFVKELIFGEEEAGKIFKKQATQEVEINYNQKRLPETEFLKINLQEFLLKDLNIDSQSYKYKLFHKQPNTRKFYIEKYKEDIIYIDPPMKDISRQPGMLIPKHCHITSAQFPSP